MKIFQVNAYWDETTGRWTATSDDIPGLVCEEGSFKDLQATIRTLSPELLAHNADFHEPDFGININSHNSMYIERPIAAE